MTPSETTVEQESQDISKSLGNRFPECYVEYNTLYDSMVYEEEPEISRRAIDLDGIIDIVILERLSRAIRGECEFALAGQSRIKNNEPESRNNHL